MTWTIYIYFRFPFPRKPLGRGRQPPGVKFFSLTVLLVHLSQRLIGELIGYSWSVVRPPSLSVVNNFKHLLQNKAKFYVEPSWVGGTKVCLRHLGHMTKMATITIYGKNPSKIFFSKTGKPIFMKLGMWHRGLQPIKVCSNDDPGMTLTYFTARLKGQG